MYKNVKKKINCNLITIIFTTRDNNWFFSTATVKSLQMYIYIYEEVSISTPTDKKD